MLDTFEIKIPQNLEECYLYLNDLLNEETKTKFRNSPESEIINYHFGLGMWMRNNWGLWGGSSLAHFFHELGIRDPDDMSSIILTSYHRFLNGQEIQLNEQIKFFVDYASGVNNGEIDHD